MPPWMRIVEKKIGDEERWPLRMMQWQLLERSPSDENSVCAGLDKRKIVLHVATIPA